MTDYLPPPPAEIVIDISPLEQAFTAQGGNNHKFVAQEPGSGQLFETNVHNYNYHFNRSNRLYSQVASFEEIIKDRVRDGDLDIDTAREFADCFDITLAREVEYCVQVEFTFTVEIPLDTDPDDIVGDLNFEVSTPYGMDADIDGYDAQVIHDTWSDVS